MDRGNILDNFKTRLKLYIVIGLVWIIVCTILYFNRIIDWVGIMVSFIFAIPTIIMDIWLTKKEEVRKSKLESISKLVEILNYIDNMIIDSINVNQRRQRAGAISKMGLIDINEQKRNLFKNVEEEKQVKKYLKSLWGKDKIDEMLSILRGDQEKFSKLLSKESEKLKITDVEKTIYDL